MIRLTHISGACAIAALSLSARAEAPAAAVDYMKDVHPILAEHCYSCHAGDNRKGGLFMGTREGLLKGSENGPVVVEGKADESLLIQMITTQDPDLLMPPKNRRLNAAEVETLRAWINAGMPWEESPHSAPTYEAPLALQSAPPVSSETASVMPLLAVEAATSVPSVIFTSPMMPSTGASTRGSF